MIVLAGTHDVSANPATIGEHPDVGPDRLPLRPGRLPLGRLSLELVARDAAGNASAVRRLAFRVRR